MFDGRDVSEFELRNWEFERELDEEVRYWMGWRVFNDVR